MSRRILCLLAALSAAAGILITTGCQRESTDHYINGTIGSNTYNKSGYVLAYAEYGETMLCAADSITDFQAGDNCWLIYFPATITGNYSDEDGAEVMFMVSASQYSSEWYMSDTNISVVVSTYSDEEVAGTFSGTLVYSVDMQEYAVAGEFHVPL